MKKGFIFDSDGLLFKTQLEFHAAAESRVLAREGIHISPQEISDRFAGILTKQVFKELAPNCDAEELCIRKWDIMHQLLEERQLEALPGMLEICAILKFSNIPICIASAAPRSWIKLCLKTVVHKRGIKRDPEITSFGQVFGDNYISAEECTKGKPDPEIIFKAIEKVDPDNQVTDWYMVGDGESDVGCALNAKIKVLYLSAENETLDCIDELKRFRTSQELADHILFITN